MGQSISTNVDHLVYLSGESWALWRYASLRGAGFPVTDILKLSTCATAEAADSIFLAEKAVAWAKSDALKRVRKELDLLKTSGRWRSKDTKRLLKITSYLRSDRPLSKLEDELDIEVREAMQDASNNLEAAKTSFVKVHRSEAEKLVKDIAQIARNERFCEAVIWQNRHAFHTGVAELRSGTDDAVSRPAKLRQKQELVANYLQRYCTKNDTIGFFGPVGWAELQPESNKVASLQVGQNLLSSRSVYFENWCIDELAKALSKDERLRQWMPPRRLPIAHIHHDTLFLAGRPPMELDAALATLLRACDGECTAADLARDMISRSELGFESENEVFLLLRQFEKLGIVVWRFEVPLTTYPECWLRRVLQRIDDKELRMQQLSLLDELEDARNSVAFAAGRMEQLDDSLRSLETSFTRITGQSPERNQGATYGARTLVYEDCQRDVDLVLGQKFIDLLSPPLCLILSSARWLTHQVAVRVNEIAVDAYKTLKMECDGREVDAAMIGARLNSIIFDIRENPLSCVATQLKQKWADILNIPEGERFVKYESTMLRSSVLSSFQAPHAGWSYGYYHSPDILIAADSIEALQRGEYQTVLGEIHIATNTLSAAFWVAQHPKPELLRNAIESDMNELHLVYEIPKNWTSVTSRTKAGLESQQTFHLTLGQDKSTSAPDRTISISEAVVVFENDRLLLRTRDKRVQFPFIEAISSMLTYITGSLVDNLFLMPNEPYSPRITFDELIVSRQTWRFCVKDILCVFVKDEAERFLCIRRWVRERGLPRFVFVRIVSERKPFFVDFSSQIYTNIFAKAVRRERSINTHSSVVVITEMIPDPGTTWLPDVQGNRYTSELRIIARDILPST